MGGGEGRGRAGCGFLSSLCLIVPLISPLFIPAATVTQNSTVTRFQHLASSIASFLLLFFLSTHSQNNPYLQDPSPTPDDRHWEQGDS